LNNYPEKRIVGATKRNFSDQIYKGFGGLNMERFLGKEAR